MKFVTVVMLLGLCYYGTHGTPPIPPCDCSNRILLESQDTLHRRWRSVKAGKSHHIMDCFGCGSVSGNPRSRREESKSVIVVCEEPGCASVAGGPRQRKDHFEPYNYPAVRQMESSQPEYADHDIMQLPYAETEYQD